MRSLLIWSVTRSRSHGSFEDYLIGMAREAAGRGVAVEIAIGDELSGTVASLLRDLGVTLHLMPVAALERAETLAAHLQKYPVDLLHAHFVTPDMRAGAVAKQAGVRKVVVSDHASRPARRFSLGVRNGLARQKRVARFEGIDHLVAVSDYVARAITAEIGTTIPATTILNGVDLSRFQPVDHRTQRQALLGEPVTGRLVCFVGQLIEEKGVGLLLDWVASNARAPDTKLVMIGTGPMRGQVEAAAACQPGLIYLGARDDVHTLLPCADVAVVPSLWDEAFGLVAAEALACGVPVVASNVGGLGHIVADDGVSGRLIERGNPAQLAGALSAMLDQDRGTARHGARLRAETLFDLNAKVADTYRLYETLCTDMAARMAS